MSITLEELIENNRRRIAEVEAMPDDAPHKAEVLEILRDGLAVDEQIARELRGEVEPEE